MYIKLAYISTLLAKAKEVWSVIKQERKPQENIVLFVSLLTRLKDIVYLQTNNQTWDWASQLSKKESSRFAQTTK